MVERASRGSQHNARVLAGQAADPHRTYLAGPKRHGALVVTWRLIWGRSTSTRYQVLGYATMCVIDNLMVMKLRQVPRMLTQAKFPTMSYLNWQLNMNS